MNTESQSLGESLKAAPLLVSDLAEAGAFDRSLLGSWQQDVQLNFNQKLGHLYEDALECLLKSSDDLEWVGSHLQVINAEGRTLGELDFLLYDIQKEIHVHLELAVKFYLAVPTEDGWIYPGPDPRDNWQRKLRHMQRHQLALSQLPAARALLKERFQIDAVEVRQLIYGRLFSPLSAGPCPLPEAIAPDAQRGSWLYLKEWSTLLPEVNEVLLIPKALWPVVITEELKQTLEALSVEELFNLGRERCTLFVTAESKEPIFLVPDDWLSDT